MASRLGIALTTLSVALAIGLAASAGPASAARWTPKPTTAPWQWQLQGRIDLSIPAKVYEVDGFETPRRTVARLHRLGRKVICYLDVGSWESYRPDAVVRTQRGEPRAGSYRSSCDSPTKPRGLAYLNFRHVRLRWMAKPNLPD